MTFSPLCITCMYNRPKVSELFLIGMKRLGIPVVAAVSDDESEVLCWDNKVEYEWIKNEPLGNKWNEIACHALMLGRWTHLLISGDDDLYSNDFRDRLEEYQDHPLVGIESTYMVSPSDKQALYFKYNLNRPTDDSPFYPIALGGGRMLKREVVEKLNGNLYNPEQNKSLDHYGDMVLMEQGYFPVIIDTDKTLCVSVKTRTNIWPIENFKNLAAEIDYEKAVGILPQSERRMIHEL